VFDTASASELVGVVEDSVGEESRLMARRMSAVAALLWIRTEEAGDWPTADPGYALITGFARTRPSRDRRPTAGGQHHRAQAGRVFLARGFDQVSEFEFG
jgi:hypothetical protein